MVVNGFWDSKKLSSLPYHPWMCLGSRCHHHHPCHQMIWVGKDFKGSISFSERQWQFVGTSCPGQQKWRPSFKLSSSFSTHSVSPVLWTMEMKLILHDGKIAFLEGVCPSSLPLFPCPTSHHSSAAACSTLCILGMLLQHVCFQTWINV